MYTDRGAEIINEQIGELGDYLVVRFRDKAFLHIIDPVMCRARDGSSLQLSHFTSNRTQWRAATNHRDKTG